MSAAGCFLEAAAFVLCSVHHMCLCVGIVIKVYIENNRKTAVSYVFVVLICTWTKRLNPQQPRVLPQCLWAKRRSSAKRRRVNVNKRPRRETGCLSRLRKQTSECSQLAVFLKCFDFFFLHQSHPQRNQTQLSWNTMLQPNGKIITILLRSNHFHITIRDVGLLSVVFGVETAVLRPRFM